MDIITHLTLGACAGQIVLGKKLGKKALLVGAISQSLPDLDVFGALFLPADKAFLFHRGIMHSIFFAILFSVILAWAFSLLVPKLNKRFIFCFAFFFGQLVIHDLLDTCNSYGTGLLEPFAHYRVSINLLYVFDPLFSMAFFVAAVILIFKKVSEVNGSKWAIVPFAVAAIYLGIAGYSKTEMNRKALKSFDSENMHPKGYFITPAPFNCMLWYIVINEGNAYYTAYSSVFDDNNLPINYELHQKNTQLLKKTPPNSLPNSLVEFADQYYTISQEASGYSFNVLRFGQVQGWQKQGAPFVFSYPLVESQMQITLLQRRRLEGWNFQAFKTYLKRIGGLKRQNPD